MYNENLKRRIYTKLEKTLHIYEKLVYRKVGELAHARALTTTQHLRTVPQSGLEPIEKDTSWGGEWMNLWVCGDYTVPPELDGQKLYAVSMCGGREQLFFLNGVPKGLFNTKNREYIGGNHSAQFIGVGRAGETYELAFECYAGHFNIDTDPYDNYAYPDIPPQGFSHTYEGVEICVRDEEIFTLLFDLRELLGAAERFPQDGFPAARAKRALDAIHDVLILSPRHATQEAVREGVRAALEISRPFFRGGNSRVFGKVGYIGHSHLDTAWLWTIDEGMRKCARTYSNALHLMEQYPQYQFFQSSALHSEWMKQSYPSIFEDMRRRVAEGRYEPNGGVYVECDCNITSGEMLVRQFLKGQQFTRENFGYTSDCFFLLDTFGYNANIPQIMRGCGTKYFYTSKIAWNELNRFPFESFVWQGIDGSEVLTHFPRTHSWPDADDGFAAVHDISLKDTTDMRLLAFGYGDGGGGPTAGMLESAERASHMEGMPVMEPMTISAFMHELETQKADLPVYRDELYLELHRGTLTQNHDVKRKNRKAEYAMRDMEYFNVLSGAPRHPQSDTLLKTVLKNQFHDILPGTSITPVYERFNREMDEVLAAYAAATAQFAGMLTDAGDSVTVFNTLSFPRTDPAVIEAAGFARDYPSQRYVDVCGREKLAVGGLRLDGFGSETLSLCASPVQAQSPFVYDGTTLQTPYATLVFDEDGYIASLIERTTGRELRKQDGAPLGVFLFGEDLPLEYDNWDVEYSTVHALRPVHGFCAREIVTDGAVEIRLRSTFEIGDGTRVVQDLVCYADTPRIDFHTLVDWQSPHRLLKAGFDLDVNAPYARCEIQYGSIRRPTTENNSLELAKFEVCNRNFTDVSEPHFGAAVLNDCKYGISLSDCNLRLSLHRGGLHPNVTGDCGAHEMTYSLLVHPQGFGAEAVVQPAYMLNIPVFGTPGAVHSSKPILSIDAPNVVAESVKPAEDDADAFVVRMYECEGTQTTASVRFGVPFARVVRTNMLEDEEETLTPAQDEVQLRFRPFEIKTIKVYR